MANQSKIKDVLMTEEISDKSIRAAFQEVWNSEIVQNYEIDDKQQAKKEIVQRLNNSSRNIQRNISHLKSCSSKRKLKRKAAADLDDLIKMTSDDEYVASCYSAYYSPKPEKLFKYVSYKWALDTVRGSYLHCGTAEYYRQKDETENKAFVGKPKVTDDFYQLVLSEVLSKLMEKRKIDMDEKEGQIQKFLDQLYFIGCLSEERDSQALWNKFGDQGVCIEIDPADLNVHKITYNDNPIDPDYSSSVFRKLSNEIEFKSRQEVARKFDYVLRMNANMGLLNRYRKDDRWSYESEWRLLVDRSGINSGLNYPVKITKVTSCLPRDKHLELLDWCEKNHIECVRRKGYELYRSAIMSYHGQTNTSVWSS